jgi:hypothetical protein
LKPLGTIYLGEPRVERAGLMKPGYPSESSRVLKKNEIACFGEYRTARLVLQASDRLQRGELAE